MVESLSFLKTPKIVFGKGKIDELGALIRIFGESALIIIGSRSFIKSSYSGKVFNILEKNNILYSVYKIQDEPSPHIIDNAVKKNRNKQINVVVSIGGGSVIDAGKAISAMIPTGESVINYLEGIGTGYHDGKKVPFIAVPTTSGTGSEATKNAVISEIGENGFKKSLRHDNLIPDIALIDPELTLSCPPDITAASGMDAFTQLLESYVSTKSEHFIDSLALLGINNIKTSLIKAYENGKDIKARTGMSYAAFISGMTLTYAGLGVVHGFAQPLGCFFKIPHGVVCGTLMGSVNRIIIEKIKDDKSRIDVIKKYAHAGKFFISEKQKSDIYYTLKFIDKIEEYTEKLKIPKLGKFGVTEQDFDKIVTYTENKNSPVKFTKEDMIRVLKERV